MLAQMPAFDFLLARVEDALVVGLLFGAGVEALINAGVEGAAEGFAYALFLFARKSASRQRWIE